MNNLRQKMRLTPTPFVGKLSKRDSARSASPRKVWGFTLIEMIVYVAILSAVFILVVNTILIVSRSYSAIKVTSDINSSASISLERLIREIRLASGVDTIQSNLGTHPGRLFLNTVDSLGAPMTLDFYIENNLLKLKKNGVLSGTLVRDNIQVTNLIFRHIELGVSEAVKIEMRIQGTEGKSTKTEDFYGTAVLRGSY